MALTANSVPKVEAMSFKPDTAWAKFQARLQVLDQKKKGKKNSLRPVYF